MVRCFGIQMYFLVFDYSFNVCACAETKHVKLLRKLHGGGEVFASCYWFSRLVDQKMNNKNTVVAVINIYCNYLQQNGELTLNILQETIQIIYDE